MAPSQSMEGTQIGSYQIERRLGTGGMGVVYIGVDLRLGRRAAIKQLLPELSGNREIVERFFNEAKAAANINHPGIVEIYDVGWHTDGSAYFAMKWLDGDSLARRLRATGPMPVQLAATIARQVASALAAAHACGIVHRDLKPDNIVLVRDDEVAIGERAIVLDFGIAKLFGDQPISQKTRTGSLLGTPAYMSPEQCRGAGEVDLRTDVYALGCILFEMLAARPPHVGVGAGEVLGMHQFVETPRLREFRKDVPPELEAVVMRMLAKQPDKRFQLMSELIAELQPFAAQGARAHERPVAPVIPIPAPAPVSSDAITQGTLSAGRGELTNPPTLPRAEKKRGFVIGLVGAAVVGGAITIGVVASQSSKSATPASGSDAAVVVVVAAEAGIPTPPPPGNSQVEALLAEARQAIVALDWHAAANLATSALSLDPDNASAKQIDDQAHRESAAEPTYDAFKRALGSKNYAALADRYAALEASSIYKRKAQPDYERMRAEYVQVVDSQAAVLAKQGKCKELDKHRAQADKTFPDDVLGSFACDTSASVGDSAADPMKSKGNTPEQQLVKATEAFQKGLYAESLRQCLVGLDLDPDDQALLRLGVLSACNAKRAVYARRFYARMNSASRGDLAMQCKNHGIDVVPAGN